MAGGVDSAEGDQRVQGSRQDFDGIAAGMDGDEQAASTIKIEHGKGGGFEGFQASMDRGGSIIAPLHQGAAAAIAEAFDERAVKCNMISDTALRAATATSETFQREGGRQCVTHDGIELKMIGGEEVVERVRLGDGAREAVEDETAGAAQTMPALAKERKDGVIADELAAMQARLSLAGGGAAAEETGAGGPEQVTGGKRARAERGFEQCGLRAFADAGRADQHQAPGVLHGGRRLAARGVSAENPRVAIACWGHGGTLPVVRSVVFANFV